MKVLKEGKLRRHVLRNCWLSVLVAAYVGESFAANPIVGEGQFLSDPAGRVGPDGQLWVFGSRDENPGRYCSKWNDALRTSDLKGWEVFRGIFSAVWIPGVDTVLYAPDAIFKDGKWHLFYCTPSRHVEGVATAAGAQGPYGNALRYPFANQIDPSIFRDDDGTLYYTWGQFSCKCAILKPDLTGVVPESIHEGIVDETHHNFHEGSQLFKRNGTYYLAYADIGRSHSPDGDAKAGTGVHDWGKCRPTCIGYATAPSPFGPYTYRGVIIDNYGCDPESWNNHGSVVEYKGRWYVLYHRTTNGSRSMRKACIEPIEFDADGLIREVEMTSSGAEYALDPFVRTEARLVCRLSGNMRIATLPNGHERIVEIRSGDSAVWRYYSFARAAKTLEIEVLPRTGGKVVVSDGGGMNLGETTVPPGDGKTPVTISIPLRLSVPTGRQAVMLSFFTGDLECFGSLEGFVFK